MSATVFPGFDSRIAAEILRVALNSAGALDCVAALELFVWWCASLQRFIQGMWKLGSVWPFRKDAQRKVWKEETV